VIPGLNDGILVTGGRELRTAYALSDASRRFAAAPIPALELHDLSEDGLDPTDAASLVSDWSRARESSGVGYTNKSLEIKTHGWNSRDLQLVEARAYSAAEIARLMGIPGALLDAAQAGTSLTYANLQDIRRDFADLSLSQYTTAIEQRLGMGDVTPPGISPVFDLDATVLRASMRERFDTYAVGIQNGILTVDEARAMEAEQPGARA
jgi:HK97 family phage portal protein